MKKLGFINLFLCCASMNLWAMEGTGEKTDPYQISSVEELYAFADIVNINHDTTACAILTKDIVLNDLLDADGRLRTDVEFNVPPAIGTADTTPYSGTFNGNGHFIKGFYCDNSDTKQGSSKSIFGVIGTKGRVENLIVDGFYTKGSFYSGILSYTNNGTIANCGVVGAINSGTNTQRICYYSNGFIVNSFSEGYPIAIARKNSAIINSYSTYRYDDFEGTSSSEFASGALTYALNQNASEEPSPWHQTIGVDAYPSLTSTDEVYLTTPCTSYTNDPSDLTRQHEHVDHICTCGDCDFLPNSEGTYEIASMADLIGFAYVANYMDNAANAVLMNDIDSTLEWNVQIGRGNYLGVFDGKGHSISGVQRSKNSALFGNIGTQGTLKNLTIKNWDFYPYSTAVFCGTNSGVIENCHNYCNLTDRTSNFAGICYTNKGTIRKCSNQGNIESSVKNVSGLVYNNEGGTIENCYNLGNISGSGYNTAGICSSTSDGGYIRNCFNYARVTSTSSTADAICSYCYYSDKGNITNCYYNEDLTLNDKYGTAVSEKDFALGAVTYQLPDDVWGQTIGEDLYPVIGGAKVYQGTNCNGYYSNDPSDLNHEHDFIDKICKYCDMCLNINAQGVFEIENLTQLKLFAKRVNKGETNLKAILLADIEVNDLGPVDENFVPDSTLMSWTVIAEKGLSTKYNGVFDGNNHTISGIYYDGGQTSYAGIFGSIDQGGVVKNLKVKNSYFNSSNGGRSIGAICGWNYGRISNCSTDNVIVYGGERCYVGGVCGVNWENIVEDCSNNGTVIGAKTSYACGGIVGETYHGIVRRCANEGTVKGSKNIGGVCGSLSCDAGRYNPTIDECYNTGKIEADSLAGGLLGEFIGTGAVTNSYNVGEVTASKKYGAIAPILEMRWSLYKDSIRGFHNCYYLNSTCDYAAWEIPSIDSTSVLPMSQEQFESGEVAYLLNQGVTDGSQPFYQNLNVRASKLRSTVSESAERDPYPLLDTLHGTVYLSEDGIYHNELSIPSNVVDECGEQVSITMNEGTLQITGAKKAIALYDANGRLIRKIGSVERTEETICIPLTNAGVYLLTVDQSQYKIVAK